MACRSDRRVALVTGAGGFTGRFVSQALVEAGFDVVGWTHAGASGSAFRAVELCDAVSVREAIAEAAPEVVVHLAAIAFVAHGDADELYRVNLMGTRHLLGALASLNTAPRNVILASSANIYGNAEGHLGEDTSPAPQNDYAVSKLAMEHMARLWVERLPITITRPFNYTGVGQAERFLIPKIVSHFRAKVSSIELGNLDVWREFNDVRDVAQIYARLAERDGSGEVFNLCSGVEHSLRDVIAQMEKISEQVMDVRVNPEFVRVNEVVHLRGDDARLCSALGTLPWRPLSDTLRWMYQSAA